jgi:hypothetical protein
MKDIAKIRLTVLRELKSLRKFLDTLERHVKDRDELHIQNTYLFLVHLCYHMNEGCLSPASIALDLELNTALKEKYAD